jgi:hypothetical protein
MTEGEQGGSRDPVGSVADEAAKLFDALQDWAAKDGGSVGGGVGDLVGEQWRSVNEHIATGGQDCTYCPVCQLIGKVREASPELRTHLAVATSSLLQAAATLVEARAPRPPAGEPQVTKIDLDDDEQPR